jgi:uncharacterized protein (DUF1499 family)
MKRFLAWLFFCLGLSACSAATHGSTGTMLAACPTSPNCVVSEGDGWNIAPLAFGSARSWDDLRQAISDLGGTIEQDDGALLHATYRSRFFGFIDDLTCRRDGDLVQIRSAARTGWYDFGVNRRRVEQLRRMVESPVSGEGIR